MPDNLQPCPSCARHIKTEESLCPFCGQATPQGFSGLVRPRGPAPLSRAAVLFMSATAVTGLAAPLACSSTSSGGGGNEVDSGHVDSGGPVAAYGPAIVDSGQQEAGQQDSGGPVAAYGPASVDSGMDSGGPVAAYGPAIIDSGSG
jgi:hypothetical protein